VHTVVHIILEWITSGILPKPSPILAVTIMDDYPAEDRNVAIGRDFVDRTLVVVYTWRGSTIRLISAREATPRERRAYEE